MTEVQSATNEVLALVRVVARFAAGCRGLTQPEHVRAWRELLAYAADAYASRAGRALSESYCDDPSLRRVGLATAGVVEVQLRRADAACERWPATSPADGDLVAVLASVASAIEVAAGTLARRLALENATRHVR